MNFDFAQAIRIISVSLIPILLGMILHEVAHGWMANKMGDPTAKSLGRLTLNPVMHLDPMGSLFFVFTALASAGANFPFVFGWAKPVPINPRNFRSLRKGYFLVSIAGACANLLLALAFTLLYKITVLFYPGVLAEGWRSHSFLANMCFIGIYINSTLAWFNLLPIPPLDGSKALASLMPADIANKYMSIGRFGMIIVIVLLLSRVLYQILNPLIMHTVNVLDLLTSFIR